MSWWEESVNAQTCTAAASSSYLWNNYCMLHGTPNKSSYRWTIIWWRFRWWVVVCSWFPYRSINNDCIERLWLPCFWTVYFFTLSPTLAATSSSLQSSAVCKIPQMQLFLIALCTYSVWQVFIGDSSMDLPYVHLAIHDCSLIQWDHANFSC